MNKNNIRCKIPCFYIALTRQNNVSVMLMILNAYFYVKIVTLFHYVFIILISQGVGTPKRSCDDWTSGC